MPTRAPVGRRLPLALFLAAGLCAAAPAAPAGAQLRSGVVARWSAEFSTTMVLTPGDGALSLTVAPSGLWVTTESGVSRYDDGQWEAVQPAPGTGGIFALVPQGLDAWAFGYEGAVWRRSSGHWSALPTPTGADLYAAAEGLDDAIWAVGFDYTSEQGTLLAVRGNELKAATEPWLRQIQLYAVARAPTGELWAGGCSYEDTPFLMRDGGNGSWRPVAAPLASGCIRHFSFAPTGFGLAAAGSDVLWFDGEAWHRSDIAPPAGLAWLRVAALSASTETTSYGPGTGWAIPAVPTWRGYVKGETPWYFDGTTWQAGKVDFGSYASAFAPGDDTATNRPFAALASDGTTAWSVAAGADGQIGLLQLAAGSGQVRHPRFDQALDVAAGPGGTVWVSGSGDAQLLGRVNGRWQDGEAAASDTPTRIQLLDLAGNQAGWALERENGASAGTRAWRMVGSTWTSESIPRSPGFGRVRALPDGRAWAATPDGQLLAWQDGVWSTVAGAPTVPLAPMGNAASPRAPTPFDVTLDGGQVVACVATGDGLYRYADGAFQRVASDGTRYVDVQLVDAHRGWALPDPAQFGPQSPTVARLVDCVPEALRLPQLPGRFGWLGPFQVMSFVGTDMVWLYRGYDGGGPQLVGWRPDEAAPFFADLDGCAIRSLAAATAPGGGVDVWLASALPVTSHFATACGPAADSSIAPYGALVSRLHVDRILRTLHLPILGLWPRGAGGG